MVRANSISRPHKTRIVATIGPASSSPAILERMLIAGMDVARLNFSHGDVASHARVIDSLRAASKATGRRVAIMADLPGPKMRIGKFATDKIHLNAGDPFTLTTDDVVGDQNRVSVTFGRLPNVVKKGDMLSLNDGYIQLEVRAVRGANVDCIVKVGGELRAKKGLNLPAIDLGISAFTDRDRELLRFAVEEGVDAVSLSFVESAADLKALRKAAAECGRQPFLVAKIERSRALDRLDEILDETDGIMIARGDLGVEVPIERIALIQKDVMRRASLRAKPVITATQMLESMTTFRLPTRAEATDVSNAILDGTDCVMLSGESAAGLYPVEAVEMLAKIAAEVEPAMRHVGVKEKFTGVDLAGRVKPEHLIAIGIDAGLDFLQPAAILVPSETGDTVRRLASLHFRAPIVAICRLRSTCQDLQFSCGVLSVHEPNIPSSWEEYAKQWVESAGLKGDFVILVLGSSAGTHRMEVIEL